MIVYACSDLIFGTKIRSTADALHVVSRPARNTEMLLARLNQVDDGKANEPVHLVVIDLDLAETGIELIRESKAHSPGLPVIAFGSHVATELLDSARECGADHVMPRSQFTAMLPTLVAPSGG